MRAALCSAPQISSYNFCSTIQLWATELSLIVPLHFLASEEFLLQEIWFARGGTLPSRFRKPTPPTPSFPFPLHPPGSIYPFPFHPSRNIPSMPQGWFRAHRVPQVIQPGSHTGDERMSSTLRHTHTHTIVAFGHKFSTSHF